MTIILRDGSKHKTHGTSNILPKVENGVCFIYWISEGTKVVSSVPAEDVMQIEA